MSKLSRKLLKNVKKISKRVDSIEEKLKDNSDHVVEDMPTSDTASERLSYCCMPKEPERLFASDVSPERERLIRLISNKWVNGTHLRYCFYTSDNLSGSQEQMDMVRNAFNIWADVGIGIIFEEVTQMSEAMVRISFAQDGSSWSLLGRGVLDRTYQGEPTMNFGWDILRDRRGVDVAVHEIGHTLGFPHEHQNPFSGIVWNEEAVYKDFAKSPNKWSRSTTYHNILRKLDVSSVEGSQWDPNSIMHYSFEKGLIKEPKKYQQGLQPTLGLTEHDIAQVKKFYPPLVPTNVLPHLKPLALERLHLQPSEQMDFIIEPEASAEYTIQTFGNSDAVMVLFELIDNDEFYLAGDDDSGENLNAKILALLRPGRRYVLRIRLYSDHSSGGLGVMMW